MVNHTTKRALGGFTLLELLTVMTILAMLASVGLVGYRHHTRVAREAVLKENLYQLRHALEQFRADKQKYPSTLDALAEKGYLRAIPEDPMTKTKEWTVEFEQADTENPEGEVGISNVRSQSTDLGDNGIPYNEW